MKYNDNIAGGCFFTERQLNKTHMKQCMGVPVLHFLLFSPRELTSEDKDILAPWGHKPPGAQPQPFSGLISCSLQGCGGWNQQFTSS